MSGFENQITDVYQSGGNVRIALDDRRVISLSPDSTIPTETRGNRLIDCITAGELLESWSAAK